MHQNVGYGIGQGTAPTLEEAEKQARTVLHNITSQMDRYVTTADPEVSAHRAQVIANLAGEFASACYALQRAAYAKATT